MRMIVSKIWLLILGAVLVGVIYSSGAIVQGQKNEREFKTQIAKLEHELQTAHEQISILSAPANILENPKVEASETSTSLQDEPKCPEVRFERNIGTGDTGDDVKALQCKLGLEPTGTFDAETKEKLTALQVEEGILSSETAYGAGYVGPRTRLFLNEGKVLVQTPKESTTSPQVLGESTGPSQPTNTSLPSLTVDTFPSTSVTPSPSPAPAPSSVPAPSPAPVPIPTATIEIVGFGTFQVELQDGDTAFAILQRASTENGFGLTYDLYDFDFPPDGIKESAFVTEIGGIALAPNEYWAFYFNGNLSPVGASAQPVVEGDTTTWKVESF